MGTKYICNRCLKEGKFILYEDTYGKEVISYPHFEVVCEHCGYGFILKNEQIKVKIKV